MEMAFQWPRGEGRTLSPCESWLLTREGELLRPLRPQLTEIGKQRLFQEPSLLPPLTPVPLPCSPLQDPLEGGWPGVKEICLSLGPEAAHDPLQATMGKAIRKALFGLPRAFFQVGLGADRKAPSKQD